MLAPGIFRINTLCMLLLAALIALPIAQADPFLEPQKLPDTLNQLNFQDSKTGQRYTVRLDERKLPVTEDFLGEEVTIPFVMEGFIIDRPDGVELHAWRILPKAGFNGISILFLHGNGGNILTNLGAGVALAKEGFRIMLLDYSGYGWSTGEAQRESLPGEAEAALALLESLETEGTVKRVLYGQSLGGHLAVVVAARNPGRIDGLVVEGAFSSHKAIARQRGGRMASALVKEPYSAEESMPTVSAPVLVMHSPDDQVVPYAMGKQLFELAPKPAMFLELEQGHLAGLRLAAPRIAAAIRELVTAGISHSSTTDDPPQDG